MRSFVPNEANRIPASMKSCIRMALLGISIITPSVAFSTSTPHCLIISRALMNSWGWETMGNMMPRLS